MGHGSYKAIVSQSLARNSFISSLKTCSTESVNTMCVETLLMQGYRHLLATHATAEYHCKKPSQCR